MAPIIPDYNTRQNAISACNTALCMQEVSFLQLPIQHPTLLTKHTRQAHSHMSSTHCFVLVKSILLVEGEQDLLTSSGDKLFTTIFPVRCRKQVDSSEHQPFLTSYCYIPVAWPPLPFLIFCPLCIELIIFYYFNKKAIYVQCKTKLRLP